MDIRCNNIIIILLSTLFSISCSSLRVILSQDDQKIYQDLTILMNIEVNNCKDELYSSYWIKGKLKNYGKDVYCSLVDGKKECSVTSELYLVSQNKIIESDSTLLFLKTKNSCKNIKFDFSKKYVASSEYISNIRVENKVDSLISLGHFPFYNGDFVDSTFNKEWHCLIKKETLEGKFQLIRDQYNLILKSEEFSNITYRLLEDEKLIEGVFVFQDSLQLESLKKLLAINKVIYKNEVVKNKEVFLIDLIPLDETLQVPNEE